MSTSIPVTIVGSTGLTGAAALRALLSSPVSFAVTSLTRRTAPAPEAAVNNSYTNRVAADMSTVATEAAPLAAPGGVYISCLGTTRAAVGSVEAQREIDLVLNRDLATKAKKDGAKTMILVSSSGANAGSWFAYPQMKGQLEEDVKALGFESTVILRPGVLLYDGDRSEKRTAEGITVHAIKCLGSWGVPIGSLGVLGDDVGDAIAQLAANPPKGVTTLYNADIAKLAAEYKASQKGVGR